MSKTGSAVHRAWILILLCVCFLPPRCASLQEERAQDHGVHCSRERSRKAWKIIDEYLLPFVEQEKQSLSTECRLHPDNDMFRQQELEKEHITANQWQCNYCKKVFRSETFLDQHFDNRHHDKLNISRNRCLADMCGALHCDYVDTLSQSKQKKGKCNPSAADKNRHLCETLANSCFPSQESSKTRRLHDFFLRQFCDAHTCNKRVKHFPRGSGKDGDSAFYYALALFTFFLLMLFYGGMYAHKREISKNIKELKRIPQKATPKLKPKPF